MGLRHLLRDPLSLSRGEAKRPARGRALTVRTATAQLRTNHTVVIVVRKTCYNVSGAFVGQVCHLNVPKCAMRARGGKLPKGAVRCRRGVRTAAYEREACF
jgi:hypothetical protein